MISYKKLLMMTLLATGATHIAGAMLKQQIDPKKLTQMIDIWEHRTNKQTNKQTNKHKQLKKMLSKDQAFEHALQELRNYLSNNSIKCDANNICTEMEEKGKLNLKNINIKTDDFSNILKINGICEKIITLDLSNCSEQAQKLNQITDLPNLKKLSLGDNDFHRSDISPSNIPGILLDATKLKKLEELTLPEAFKGVFYKALNKPGEPYYCESVPLNKEIQDKRRNLTIYQ